MRYFAIVGHHEHPSTWKLRYLKVDGLVDDMWGLFHGS
jgi:hypothetical protein